MIHKKLLEFQKKNIVVEKDGKNPHFQSRYVTLNEVLEKVKGPLNELGILIIQKPSFTDNTTFGLATILYDTEDDTSIEAFLPYVESTNAQKMMSNNTYNRRVSLVTMLGLQDDDDDGNVASAPKAPQIKKQSSADELPEINLDEDLGF